jgi:VanZ family protein
MATPALAWRRLWRVFGMALVALIVVLSLMPPVPGADVAQADKVAHCVAYGVLMAWFAQLDESFEARHAWAAAFAVLGIVLELGQQFTPGRSFDVLDMIANAGGVVLGWIAAPPRVPRVLAWLEGAFRR